ncbi:MAG TPA: hypothetical protein VG756_15570 [Pseudonocardiaceae bacterium]|nr:hypothetical protein [Pseudonocardiaceae bacterium]
MAAGSTARAGAGFWRCAVSAGEDVLGDGSAGRVARGGPSGRELWVTAGGLLVVTVAVLIAEIVAAHGTWVLALTTAFVLCAPGWAIAAYARAVTASFRWSVGIAVGIAIGIVLAQGMVLLHFWHPRAALAGLALVTLAPLVHHIWKGLAGNGKEVTA